MKYFEPGHTFMSADSLHHSVENSMKKIGKIYDFADFVKAVESANSSRVIVKEIKVEDFAVWPDNCSKQKLYNKKQNVEYPYVDRIKMVTATRGQKTLSYKNSYENDEEWKLMDFLKRPGKNTHPFTPREKPCGIPADKRDDILKKLGKLMPQNRLEFWQNIPISDV